MHEVASLLGLIFEGVAAIKDCHQRARDWIENENDVDGERPYVEKQLNIAEGYVGKLELHCERMASYLVKEVKDNLPAHEMRFIESLRKLWQLN